MSPLKTKKKKVKVKVQGYAVCDGAGDILNFGTVQDNSKDRIFIIYGSESEARRNWAGFNVIPCEITYSLN